MVSADCQSAQTNHISYGILIMQCTILLADNCHFPFIYGKWPGKIRSIRLFLSVHCKSNVDYLFGCQPGEMKRSRPQIDSETKSRSVTYLTFQKWRCNYDWEYSTVSWLDCEKKTEHGKVIVTCLKCVVCTKHKESIKNRRNFNSKWIDGAATMKTSNI